MRGGRACVRERERGSIKEREGRMTEGKMIRHRGREREGKDGERDRRKAKGRMKKHRMKEEEPRKRVRP